MAKGINIGTLKMGNMYVGGKKVTAVYVGATKIYPLVVAKASVAIYHKNQWQKYSSSYNGYTVYKSFSNYNVSDSVAQMKFTFTGVTEYKFYILLSGEGDSYDYVYVTDENGNEKARANTNKGLSTDESTYTEVSYTNLSPSSTYTVLVNYRKDSSVNKDDDCGYLLLPNETTTIVSESADVVVNRTLTIAVTNGAIRVEYTGYSNTLANGTLNIPDGTVVTLTLYPSSGYEYTGWGGSLTKTITMSSNQSVTVNCTKKIIIASVSVNLNSQWQRYSGTAISGYTVYQSAKNRGVNSSFDTMKLTFNGNYDTYEFYICSDGENGYDYVWVSQLNASQPTSNTVPSDALATHKTVNSVTGGTYTKVTLSNVKSGDYLWVTYRKDGVVDGTTDRGYLLLPTATTQIASVTNEYTGVVEVKKYRIVFDDNGADNPSYNTPLTFSSETSVNNDSYSYPDLTGYYFAGWAATATSSKDNKRIAQNSSDVEQTSWTQNLQTSGTWTIGQFCNAVGVSVDSLPLVNGYYTLTLYAQWEKIQQQVQQDVVVYLDGNWQRSSIAVSGYKVFESIDISGSQTSRFLPCRISWSGISDFKFGIWSDSEANSSTALSSSNYYDYTVAFKVGITPELADAADSTKIQKHTKGIGNGKGSPAANLSTIESTCMADYSGQSSGMIRVAYKTDTSTSQGADKGYILIPDKYNVYVY